MKTIQKTEFYRIAVDQEKNRIYIDVIGHWANVGLVPNYLDEIKESLSMITRNFTMVVDARNMIIAPAEVAEIHKTVQNLVTEAGLFQAAEIVPEDVISKLQTDNLGKKTGIPKGMFSDVEEGEAWLEKELKDLVK